jgi:hypothetical protein
MPDQKYRARLDYSEDTPFDPDPKVEWGKRAVSSTYELAPGAEWLMAGLLAHGDSQHIVGVTVLPPPQ